MIFILLVLCIVEFQLAASCVYGDGLGCRFPCRCETGGCDPVTGTCTTGGCAEVLPSGHGYGWKGVGCRIGNIAYDKNTSQLGSWEGHTSERAVDGNTNGDINHGSCSHSLTAKPNTAWWMVDLGKKHVIEEIIIFNRLHTGEYRTNDFDIRIGMTSTLDDQDLCVFYNDGAKAVLTLRCTEDVTEGRYVSMRRRWRPTDTNYEFINICEFVVIGYEPIECSNKCSGSCDDLSGCDTCGEGFKLPDCIDECDSGTWGTNCVSQCGQCSGNKPCDRQTGECRDGCEQWYLEDKCDVHIVIPQLNTSVVKMDVVSSSVLTVTWQRDDNIQDKLAEHYFYRVQYGPTGEDKISSEAIFQNREHLSFNLTDLTPNTEYEVIIVPYRVQDTEEAGTSTLAVTNKTLCRPSGPSEPFINVTTNRHSWTVYFTPLRKLDSGCDDMASYILNVAHGDIIVHSVSVWNVSSVDLPFKPVYVEAVVWIEAINNGIISTDSKKEILFMGSSTVATIMSTRSDEVESEETQDKTILIISCVIGVFGLAALVVGIILTVKRSKLCVRNNSNTEMTQAYENAKTFDPKNNHRNDMMQISPNYENTQDTKVTQKDNVDNGRNDNIEYEEIPGQQMTNPYETLDVNDHDATPTVYQSFN